MNIKKISLAEVARDLAVGLAVEWDGDRGVIFDIGTGRVKARSELSPLFGATTASGHAQYGFYWSFGLTEIRRLRSSKRGQKMAIVERADKEIREIAFRSCQSLESRGIRIPAHLKKLAGWNPPQDRSINDVLAQLVRP